MPLVASLPRPLRHAARRALALLLGCVLALAWNRAPDRGCATGDASGAMASMTMDAHGATHAPTPTHGSTHAPDGCGTGLACAASAHCVGPSAPAVVAAAEPSARVRSARPAGPLPVLSQAAPEPTAPPPRA